MATTHFANEAIRFAGCFSLTRANVYAIVLADTADKRAADRAAFGSNTRLSNEEPITVAQFRNETNT